MEVHEGPPDGMYLMLYVCKPSCHLGHTTDTLPHTLQRLRDAVETARHAKEIYGLAADFELLNEMHDPASLPDEGSKSDESSEARSNAGSSVSTQRQPRKKPETRTSASQTNPQVNFVHTVV